MEIDSQNNNIVYSLSEDIATIINKHSQTWPDNLPELIIAFEAFAVVITRLIISKKNVFREDEVCKFLDMFVNGIKTYIEDL